MLRGLLLTIAISFAAQEGIAQTHVLQELRPAPSLLRAPVTRGPLPSARLAEVSDTTVRRVLPATYWLEGALLGGTVAGLLLSAFALEACSNDDTADSGPCWDNVVLAAGLGVGGGGTLGGLLGGLIRKPESSVQDSLPSD